MHADIDDDDDDDDDIDDDPLAAAAADDDEEDEIPLTAPVAAGVRSLLQMLATAAMARPN